MDTNSRKDNASLYSWGEILPPLGVSVEKTEVTANVEITTWAVDDDPSIQFQTFGETDHLFALDENGELRIPHEFISKYEALRRLHFRNQAHLTNSFISSGSSIIPNAFDLLAEARFGELSSLKPEERFVFDPAFRSQVENDLTRIVAQEEAKRRARKARNELEDKTPSALLLSSFLEKELSPVKFLIEGLLPVNGTITVVASRKVGKSTFIYNIMYSLVTGEPLLGCFGVTEFDGRIGFVNFELTEEQAQDWFRRSPIGSTDKIAVWNLRGKPNPFRSDEAIRDFAQEVKALNVRVLILDPFSSAFRGGNSQDNDEVKEFWLKTDAFKESSGVKELIVPVHAGRDESRSRGASALDDHPDAILHINKLGDGTRTFHAFGRDVEVEAGELAFDRTTLLLSYKGPVSDASRIERVAKHIEGILIVNGKMTATALVRSAKRNKDDIREARELLVKTGRVVETQVGQTKFYEVKPTLIAPSPFTASGAQPMPVGSASSPYMGEATALSASLADEKLCSQCGDLGSDPISFMGMRITMCWKCYEVIEVYLEEPVSTDSKSETQSGGVVA